MDKIALNRETVDKTLEALKVAQTELREQETTKVAAARAEAEIQASAKQAASTLVERGHLSPEKAEGWVARVCNPQEGHQTAVNSLVEVVKTASGKTRLLGRKRPKEASATKEASADDKFIADIGL